jgi:carboxylesterase type B
LHADVKSGQSAGGGSVVSHLIADGGKTRPSLFRRAILSSPFWPRNYRYDSPQAEELFQTLANLTGCGGDVDVDPLECLKQVPVQTILDANQVINSGS